MREILFRGKRVDNGEWVEGYLYIRHDGTHEIGYYNEISNIERLTADVDSETVGQYTGLKDKNGKRIFEGDVIEGIMNDPLDPGATWRGTVVWYGSGWGEEEQSGCIGYLDEMSMARISVIGNIHDNPELLKGE